VNGTRLLLQAVLITAGFAVADGVILYLGTEPTWTFVHRWVLMAVGVGSGIGWAALVMRQTRSRAHMSDGFR